jgi:bifunctional UDP-N-acetylglucosamine pyrophosphorylase/glucosamine-1-phosphate N-acetyltransferase
MLDAVILAAGKGTRLEPLTCTRPKSLIPIAGKPIIQHNLDALVGLVDRAIIVIGYKGEMIEQQFGNAYRGLPLSYVIQDVPDGTGGALLRCKPLVTDDFLVLNGDDIYARGDVERLLSHDWHALLVAPVDRPQDYGIVTMDDGKLVSLVEKPEHPQGNLAFTGMFRTSKRIFDHTLRHSPRREYEYTDYLNFLRDSRYHILVETARDGWHPIGYPWHVLQASERLLPHIARTAPAESIPGAGITITDGSIVRLGKGTLIKGPSVIDGHLLAGEGTTIGPFAYIRGWSVIGNGCHIGAHIEIKASIIDDDAKVPHLSYVGDSYIGRNANLGAGTITANYRFDHGPGKMLVGDKLVTAGQKKLGSFLGDDVQTGINVSLLPCTRVWPGVKIGAGQTVGRDVKEDVLG